MKTNQRGSVMRVVGRFAKSKLGGIALQKLEQLATIMGVDELELLKIYVETKNSASRKKFAATPYSQRILLLPQCLRSRQCPAELKEYGYECQACGKCSLNKVISQAKALGYKNVFILPGGAVVSKIIAKEKPRACLGVACFKELVLGSFLCEKFGVIAQGVSLLRDGCVNTEVDWKTVNDALCMTATMRG